MDRKRRLMENNNGWPLRSQLFDGAPFRLPLLSTAVPASAATGTTATFTRATAKTWPNNDGYLVTGVAGEIGFVGARRVDNLIRLGAAQSSTLAVAASVTMTLPAGAYQFSMGAGTGTVTFSGTGGATGTLAASASGRTFVAKTISAGTLIVTASVATLIDIQVVSMVAETDQTTAREYVSVGVVQRNLWLNSNVCGSQAVQNVTATAGQAVGPTGLTDLCSIAETAVNFIHRLFTSSAMAIAANSTLTVSAYVRDGTQRYVQLGGNNGGAFWITADLQSGTITEASSSGGGTYTSSSITLVSTGLYRLTVTGKIGAAETAVYGTIAPCNSGTPGLLLPSYLGVITNKFYAGYFQMEVGSSATEYQATGGSLIYHGSGVDGVKCFPTDLSGNPIPSTTLLGYSAEGARTNLCLRSNAFTTTWAATGTGTITQNVVGPDGGTTAWTINDTDGAAYYFIQSGNITVSASTAYTVSVFIKKTSSLTVAPLVELKFTGGVATYVQQVINTVSGTATNFSGSTAPTSVTVASFNNDFWRVSIVATSPVGTTTANVTLYPAINADASATGVVATQGSAVFYGAQVELGSFASSYIATTTIAVARNADVLTYSSAGNFSDTAGWCYAETTFYASSTQNKVLLGSTTVGTSPMYQGSAGYRAFDGTNAPLWVSGMNVANTTYKTSATWGGSTMSGSLTGTVSSPSAYDGSWSFSNIQIGGGNGTNELFGTIRGVRVGQRQLSTSEQQAVTA